MMLGEHSEALRHLLHVRGQDTCGIISYACEGRADDNWSTITIIDSKPPYPNRPTPPSRPLYALEKTLQNRVPRCRFIVFRDKQQGKMTRDLFPRIREFVWLRLRFPRRYEGEDVVEEMEEMEETPE